MYRSAERVMCQTATTGTGPLALGAAVAGYRTLADAVAAGDLADGDTVPYAAEAVDDDGLPTGAFEVGTGTVADAGATLNRTAVRVSSNGNALVDFAAGPKVVYLVEEDEPHARSLGFTAENKDAATIPAGAAVAVHGSGTGVRLADAVSSGRECVGLALAATGVGFAADVRTVGLVQLADWSAVTEESATTLAARATYYLSATPGRITATAPTAAGSRVQVVGRAVGTDTLDLAVGEAILL